MALEQITAIAALVAFLNSLRANHYQQSELRLYQNNVIPVVASTVGAFIESTFVGYQPKLLNAWGAPYDNGQEEAQTDHPVQAFACTGGGAQPIFGIFVTQGGLLTYAQRLDPADLAVPFMIGPGQQFLYAAHVRLRNLAGLKPVMAGEMSVTEGQLLE